MSQAYDNTFFDWVDLTAIRSANGLVPLVMELAVLTSVVDVGCGSGAWLGVWSRQGVTRIRGLDGAHVDRDRLTIPADQFETVDLTTEWSLAGRYDLAQSLEVAEHLPAAAGRHLVAQLCRLADIVLFSAAQPGQGGEMHVNEQPLSYWAHLFFGHGFAAYDCIRPRLTAHRSIDPWYRYNTILYANAAGAERLVPAALAARVADPARLESGGDFTWRMRRAVLRSLPVAVVTALSRLRYRTVMRTAKLTSKINGQ
jgi:Methyltransferase domain